MVFRSLRRYQRPLLIGVTVFVLLTFSITGSVITALSPKPEAEIAQFTLPSGRTFLVDLPLYREYAALLGSPVAGFVPQPWFAENRRPEGEDVYAFIMLYALAEDLGLDVGPSMISKFLQAVFQGKNEEYRGFLRARGWRASAFEEWLRRVLLVDRYRSFLVTGYAIPTPEEIEAKWKELNALLTVDAVSFAPAAFEEAVAAKEPTDAELEELRKGLTPAEQGRLRKSDRIALEGLSVEVGESLPEKLAALLEGEEEPAEADLRAFYERYSSRYLAPPGTETRPAEAETRPAEATEEPKTLPFEEVVERVRREHRFQRAMEKVLQLARAEGAPSLETLAAERGLEPFSHALSTRTEISALPRFSDPRELDACFDLLQALEGGWVSRPLFSPLTAFVVRVTERVPPGLATLEHDRSDFVELWRSRQKVSDARAAAQAFRDAVDAAAGGENPETAFEREAQARGLEVKRVGPFSLGARTEPGFFEKPAGLERFLMSRVDLFQEVEPGGVVGPQEQGADEAIVVAKLVAREDPDPANMRPREVREAFRAVTQERREKFLEDGERLFERLATALRFERKGRTETAPAD